MAYGFQDANPGAAFWSGAQSMQSILDSQAKRDEIRRRADANYGVMEPASQISMPGQVPGLQRPRGVAPTTQAPAMPGPAQPLDAQAAGMTAQQQADEAAAQDAQRAAQAAAEGPALRQEFTADMRPLVKGYRSEILRASDPRSMGPMAVAKAREEMLQAGVLEHREDPLFYRFMYQPDSLTDAEIARFEGFNTQVPQGRMGLETVEGKSRDRAETVFPLYGMQGADMAVGPYDVQPKVGGNIYQWGAKGWDAQQDAEAQARKAAGGGAPKQVQIKDTFTERAERAAARIVDRSLQTGIINPDLSEVMDAQVGFAQLLDQIDDATPDSDIKELANTKIDAMVGGVRTKVPASQVFLELRNPAVARRKSGAWKRAHPETQAVLGMGGQQRPQQTAATGGGLASTTEPTTAAGPPWLAQVIKAYPQQAEQIQTELSAMQSVPEYSDAGALAVFKKHYPNAFSRGGRPATP